MQNLSTKVIRKHMSNNITYSVVDEFFSFLVIDFEITRNKND